MRAVERLAVDCGRSLTTGVEDPSLMSGSSAASAAPAERWGSVEKVGVRSWIEAGVVSVSLRGES